MIMTFIAAEYGHQPGWAANPARGQVNKKILFPCSRLRLRTWSLETGSAVPSLVSLIILHTQAQPGAYSTDSPRFCGGVQLFMPPYAIGSVPSLSGHEMAYRRRSLPSVRLHKAKSPQSSSSNGCYLCRYHHGPTNMHLSFPTTTYGMKRTCAVQ